MPLRPLFHPLHFQLRRCHLHIYFRFLHSRNNMSCRQFQFQLLRPRLPTAPLLPPCLVPLAYSALLFLLRVSRNLGIDNAIFHSFPLLRSTTVLVRLQAHSANLVLKQKYCQANASCPKGTHASLQGDMFTFIVHLAVSLSSLVRCLVRCCSATCALL